MTKQYVHRRSEAVLHVLQQQDKLWGKQSPKYNEVCAQDLPQMLVPPP